MIQIKHKITGEVLREGNLQTVAEVINQWVAESRSKSEVVNLSYADLRSADLSYADLSYADLSYADLRSADLRSANLFDLGQDCRGYRFFLYFEPDAVIRAGCRKLSIDAAFQHWNAAHEDAPILRAEILGKLAAAQMIIEARKEGK